MIEPLKDSVAEYLGGSTSRLTRREFLALFGVVALRRGVHTKPPSLSVDNMQMDREQPILEISWGKNGGLITITSDGKIIYEPESRFFDDQKTFKYVHRGGNSFENIDKAYEEGANILDVDANHVGDVVYGEHGIILHARFPLIIDVNEGELRLGGLNTYQELIEYIAANSTEDHPIAVKVELKRGSFSPETVLQMLSVNRKYNIPAIIYATNPDLIRELGIKFEEILK